jgi:hypothetical protein
MPTYALNVVAEHCFTGDLATLSARKRTTYRPLAPASQTASQSVRHSAIIFVHPQTSPTPTAASSCAPEITDTEAVIGSLNFTDT